MEPVGLDFINHRVGPGSATECARRPRRPTGPADQLPKPSGTPILASASQRRSNPASGAPRGRYRPWWMTSIISGTVVLLMRGRPCVTPAVTS
jgi:hypothetical protein